MRSREIEDKPQQNVIFEKAVVTCWLPTAAEHFAGL